MWSRERLGLPILQRFLEHIVALCRQDGLVWGKELIVDATKVRPNAEIDSLVPRWYHEAKTHLDDLFAQDYDEAAAPHDVLPVEDAERSVTRLSLAGSAADHARLAEQNRPVWKLLDEQRLELNRPPSCTYQRQTDQLVSTTDPDATPLQS